MAALSEVATAAPSRADAGLFEFNSGWLSEQTAEVDPSVMDGARRLRLDGFRVGSLKLGLDLQKAAPPPDPLSAFHYTVADARKDWLRSLTAAQPRRLSLSGAVDRGAARGLSFSVTRNDGGADAAMDSQLSFSRSGFSADIHMRNVGGHFARSALMSDDEWNRLKDIVGWRQTDMRFQWQAMPGLSLVSEMNKGTKGDSGETKDRRRLGLDWNPSKATHLSLYNEVNTTGGTGGGSHATRRGFAWNQTVHDFAFALSQEDAGGAAGKSSRTRTLSFATPQKARTAFSYTRTYARNDSGSSSVQAMKFHARPAAALDLLADYTLSTGPGDARTNQGLRLQWKPAGAWKFDGQWRQDTAAIGPMADFHLTGDPGKATHVDARIQRITDPKNPYRKQDTVRVERKPKTGVQWTLQYSALEEKEGDSASVLEATARMETSLGLVTAAWRDGDADVLPGYSDVAFTSAKGKDSALTLNAHLRTRRDAATTQTLDVTWKASDRMTLSGGYQRNPEDKHGQPQYLDGRRMAMSYELCQGMRLDVSHSVQGGPGGATECSDLSLKGKLDEITTVDLGVAFHTVPGLPNAPAYHVDVERMVDEDNRFHVAVERKTQAVQRADELTASVQVVSVF